MTSATSRSRSRNFDFVLGNSTVNDSRLAFSARLGFRPTFTRQTLNRKTSLQKKDAIIPLQEPGVKMDLRSPEDFNQMVNDEDFIPGPEEGLTDERMLQVKRWNDENGDNIEHYKQMVKESLAAIWNLKQIRNSYYIHSSRKKTELSQKAPVIAHEDVMRYLQSLYPEGRFSSRNSQEFR